MTTVQAREKPLVLVVDDDRTMRLLLRESMELAGLDVEEAADGAQALLAFERVQPDIVLMDVEMPELNGFSACAALRKQRGGARVPVLMVTGLGDTESIEQAYQAGATDFISKPINWVILGHRVRYMLRGARALEELHGSRSRLANAQRIARLGNWEWNIAEDRVHCSAQAQEVLGLASDTQPRTLDWFLGNVHEQDRGALERGVRGLISASGSVSMDHRLVADGENGAWVHLEGETASAGNGAVQRIVGTVQDISQRRETEAALLRSEHKAQVVMDSAPMVLFATDRDGVLTMMEGAAADAIAPDPESLVGLSLFDIFRDRAEISEPVCMALVGHTSNANIRMGRTTFETRYSPLRSDNNEVIGVTAVWFDVTERVLAEERIRYLAQYDSLTGLPNREMFRTSLNEAISRAESGQTTMALLYLDLDRFKSINDTLGHYIGDRLLVAVAERLRACVRKTDTIARQGGDEFIVILEELEDAQICANVAEKILQRLGQPFNIEGHEVFVTASIGIIEHAAGADDPDFLLRNADVAMYRAKELGRNRSHVYSSDMNERALERLRLENDLRRALERSEFELYYQPQLAVDSGRVIGVEALLRWNHPTLGLVSPGEFIPMLEETGMIVEVGEWVLIESCRQNQEWQNRGLDPISMAVNLSSRQFADRNLNAVVRAALERTKLQPCYLELEITESVVMENTQTAVDILQELVDLGISVAIDDFGTGYSSLGYLKRFPAQKLKIDRSFVMDITTEPDDRAITTAIISLAHSLNMRVVAEGVETLDHLAFLEEHDCDECQGYLFSPPRPAAVIGDMLAEGDRAFAPQAVADAS